MEKEIICTVCPRGCHICVTGDGKTAEKIQGYGCNKGLAYAKSEYSNPVRILTTVVKVLGKNELLPVRSNAPVPFNKLMDCMEVIKAVKVNAPVNRYDVIVNNIADTGVDIIATKEL